MLTVKMILTGSSVVLQWS